MTTPETPEQTPTTPPTPSDAPQGEYALGEGSAPNESDPANADPLAHLKDK